ETRALLNRLPVFVYAVSQTGYRVLYVNDTLQQRFPALQPGMICHCVLWGRAEPCPFCPLEDATRAPFHKTLLYNTPFGSTMDLSCSRTLWNDNEAACLMVLSEHFVTDKEQEQRNKRETIALALSMSHDTVIDIDPATGRYEFLSALPQERVPRAGDYETEIPKMYRGFAAPAYLDLVLKTFSLAHMQEVFASGIPEVSLDFQCMTDTGYIWKHRRAVPYTLTDGSRHIIGYSHDITPQKQAEQHRIQTEQAYRLALQASYAEIYEVDPYANSIVCIQNNTEPRVVVPLSGLFREDVQALARADIPPEHQEQYLAHYNNAAIAALLSANTEAGRTNVLEYRSKAGTND
ncbi:MAG: PAS domain-containing protein, partial [Bilophila sp.]